MNSTIRRLIDNFGLGRPYRVLRSTYHELGAARRARRLCVDPSPYLDALRHESPGTSCVRLRDGLTFEVRRNRMDAGVLGEVFLDKEYTRDLVLPLHGTVIDIGGYIGDFAIFAVKHLQAQRVITIEPSPYNWELLKRNVRLNSMENQIVAIRGAVTAGQSIKLNLEARNQARVSAHYGQALTEVRGFSLDGLLAEYNVGSIGLLKIDCEGGEYEILRAISDRALERIRAIVFEFHEIDGFAPQLRAAKERLLQSGFALGQRGHIVTAKRQC